MGLHTKTIKKIEDSDLCNAVLRAIAMNYSRRYIQRTYGVTRRELERIIQYHAGSKVGNRSTKLGPDSGTIYKLIKDVEYERNSKIYQSDLSTRAG